MKVILARPRGFCAGVERAVEIVELALEYFGAPVYVRHEIVHNKQVVEGLARKGAIFVEDIAEIPEGAAVVFSAHGVSPLVWEEAREKHLEIIDATCPLVTKVHLEVKKYAREGRTVFLIGHKDHVEVIGTSGEAPENVVVISMPQEAQVVEVPDASKVAYVTQTTLSVDDTKEIIAILKHRFPMLQAPKKSDICYATQNRQDAVKKLAASADIIFIVGSKASSNSNRLVETARSCGVSAYLVENAQQLSEILAQHPLGAGAVVGISSGASTPETLVYSVIEKLKEYGVEKVEELDGIEEHIHFPLPLFWREVKRIA